MVMVMVPVQNVGNAEFVSCLDVVEFVLLRRLDTVKGTPG